MINSLALQLGRYIADLQKLKPSLHDLLSIMGASALTRRSPKALPQRLIARQL